MNIITISREFGSGGRELGKRLADELNVPCYDHEIIELIAKEHGFDENYVATVSEKTLLASYPMTIGHHFSISPLPNEQHVAVMATQEKIIRRFAEKSSCVIVGRGADIILKDMSPLNIFVYASQESKLRRCRERADENENFTDKEMLRKMKSIDKDRAALHELIGDTRWGSREAYHLCVNTSDIEIKSLVPALAAYAESWFSQKGKMSSDGK